MANRAYKYRLYPNRLQAKQFAQTFGCVRFVYNQCLLEHERRYKVGEKFASRLDMNNYCTRELKTQYPFLREVDKFSLTNAVYHLDEAYKRMFRHEGRHPKFKSKRRSRKSYTTNRTNGNIKVLESAVQLPKVGRVKAIIHRKAPQNWRLKSATVSQTADGVYFCSILYEYDEQIEAVDKPQKNAVGLDYKSNGLYVSSDGECADMPHFFRQNQRRLKKAQRKLRHKEKGSNNRNKQVKKIAKLHRRITNQRRDFLHKESNSIAKRYDFVSVESLDMRALSNRGFGNGKATLDNGYGMFLAMLEYKLVEHGKVLLRIDKWYPSSQICCKCGARNDLVKNLRLREWICPECGIHHDRDRNAALNIRSEGIRLYTCG